jgi:hypothetical protein
MVIWLPNIAWPFLSTALGGHSKTPPKISVQDFWPLKLDFVLDRVDLNVREANEFKIPHISKLSTS